MNLVQHAGTLVGAEQASYNHSSVSQGGIEKATAYGRRESTGECGDGLSGLGKTAQYGYLLQTSEAGIDGGVRRLEVGSEEP